MSFQIEVAARTVYGEARGEPQEGRLAVAHVLVNRMKSGRWGTTLASVCLAKWQFSAWDYGDPNRDKLLTIPDTDKVLGECRAAVLEALTAGDTDPTLGAMFYQVTGTGAPWSAGKTPCVTIGNHAFYNNIS